MASDDPAAGLKAGIARLLESGEYSDLTIVCKDKIFKAHKSILCTQSSFFEHYCKNSDFKESENVVINLSHEHECAIEAMLQYLYTSDYFTSTNDGHSCLRVHVKVYCLAQRYETKGLQQMAATYCASSAKSEWDSPDFPLAIQDIYLNTKGHTDKALRQMVVNVATHHIDELLLEDDEEEDGDFARMMEENGEFGKDLARALLSCSYRPKPVEPNFTNYNCISCCTHWQILEEFAKLHGEPICPYCEEHLTKTTTEIKSWTIQHECNRCNGIVFASRNMKGADSRCPYCDIIGVFITK